MPTTVRVFQIQVRAQSVRIARRQAARVLDQLQDEARVRASGGEYSTGRLASSIYKSGPQVLGTMVRGSVGSRLGYAAVVEKGARIHNIFPKGAPHIYRFGAKRRPMLRFVWHGHVVYMNQVPGGPGTVGRSHPGMRGKHWLSKSLVSVALRNNFKVVVYDI